MSPWKRLLPLLALLFSVTILTAAADDEKGSVRILSDPETTHYLDELGRPLVRAAGLREGSIRFFVVLDANMNAFALPNGVIVFNSGLLLSARSRDELAAVMAHELGHVAAGHHAQLQSAAKGISIRSMIISALGVGAGLLTGNSDVGQAAAAIGQASGQSQLLSIIRAKETQSDRLAIGYLAEGGFDPIGMSEFLNRIRIQQRLTTMPPPYLLTHPVSSTRVFEARDQAQLVTSKPSRPSAEENWRLARVRAKLKAGNDPDPNTTIERFRQEIENNPEEAESLRYGLAIALRYAGRLPEADKELAPLLEKYPNDAFLLRERGLLRIETGHFGKAQEDFKRAIELKPGVDDLWYRLAFSYHEDKQYQNANKILRQLTTRDPDDPRTFYLLGLNEGKLGRLGPSHLALAHYNKLNLRKNDAIWHLKEAMKYYPKESTGYNIAKSELEFLQHKKPAPWISWE